MQVDTQLHVDMEAAISKQADRAIGYCAEHHQHTSTAMFALTHPRGKEGTVTYTTVGRSGFVTTGGFK
jgi:hypothetical protein